MKVPKTLTLQITRPSFVAILNGEQKIEHRNVYPTNARQYVIIEDSVEEETGEEITTVLPIHYDMLRLINGRRKDSPRLLIEIKDAEFVILTDDEGNDLTFEENGKEYYVCQVWYHLGKVLETENVENLKSNK